MQRGTTVYRKLNEDHGLSLPHKGRTVGAQRKLEGFNYFHNGVLGRVRQAAQELEDG